MVEFAPGLPYKESFGDLSVLPKDIVDWIVQKHIADKAKTHYDIRMGTPSTGLYSWAARKGLPKPGEKHLAVRQPLHTHAYGKFEGTIPTGYGKGTVETEEKGKIKIFSADKEKITFAVIHKKQLQYFSLIKSKDDINNWLLINTTPMKPLDAGKLKYTRVPAEDVDKLFDRNYLASQKIDGASALVHLMKDKLDILSYRTSVEDQPIIHTLRVAGKPIKVNIPKDWRDTILRGELYGVHKPTGKSIPPQELGGLLNSSVMKSLSDQQKRDIALRVALFDIAGKETQPYGETLAKLKQALKFLPRAYFNLPQTEREPEKQKQLWQETVSGQSPVSEEGLVFRPTAGGVPIKVKKRPESRVYIRSIFPGEGKYKDTHAGGFEYSLGPDTDIVGRVGTGFSDEERKRMMDVPDDYIGRLARIYAQGTFPSGAYRAPSYIARHEDYMKTAGEYSIEPNTAETRAATDAARDEVRKIYGPPTRQLPMMPTVVGQKNPYDDNAWNIARSVRLGLPIGIGAGVLLHWLLKDRTDEKLNKQAADALMGSLALAGGLGALALRKGVNDSSMQEASDRFVNLAREADVYDPREFLGHYSRYGSELSNYKLFGAPTWEFIKPIRQMMSSIKPDKNTEWTPDSAGHYVHFAKGPYTGYMTRLQEMGETNEGKGLLGGIYNYVRGQPAKVLDPLTQNKEQTSNFYNRYHMDKLKQDVGGLTDVPDVIKGIHTHADTLAQSKFNKLVSDLSRDQQLQVFNELDPYIKKVDPELWKHKQIQDFSGGLYSRSPAIGYSKLIRGLTMANAALKAIGYTGAAVGGGMLLYWLLKKLTAKKPKVRRRRVQQEE